MKSHVRRMSWSTDQVAGPESFDYWMDVVCDSIVQAAVRPTDEMPFAARIEHVALDRIGLTSATSVPQQVTRTKRQIARAQDELVLVNIQTAGRCLIRQDGRSAAVKPGAMAFLDSTRPYSLEFPEKFSMVVVGVPRSLLPGRSLAGATAVELDGRGPGRLVSDFLIGLSRKQCEDPQVAGALLPHAVGLLESVIDWAAGEATEDSPSALATERIHRFVRRHIQDQSLDAASVAAACGLSRRSLFRALEDTGESLTALIRRLRVERAGHLLRSRPHWTVAVIAAQSGFGGPVQLHRAFKCVLGTTPGAYRAAAQAADRTTASSRSNTLSR